MKDLKNLRDKLQSSSHKSVWTTPDGFEYGDCISVEFAIECASNLLLEARKETNPWWITTDFFANDGKKVMGPFSNRELALEVRTLLEGKADRETFAVDSELTKGEESNEL